MRKLRKGKTREIRVCDECEDKNIYDAVMKNELKAEEEIGMREEIVRLKWVEVGEEVVRKEGVMEGALVRKMRVGEGWGREREGWEGRVREVEKQEKEVSGEIVGVEEEK